MSEPTGADPTLADLPEAVRRVVVGFAATALGAMPAGEVPARLRQVARFAPSRRAKAGGALIAEVIDGDPVLRRHAARVATAALPAIAEAPASPGSTDPAPAADPVDAAALAYLTRPDGWADLVRRAAEQVQEQHAARSAEQASAAVERLRDQLVEVQGRAEAEIAGLRRELGEARAEIGRLRTRLGEARAQVRALEPGRAADSVADAKANADAELATTRDELERLRTQLAAVEASAQQLEATARRQARDARTTESIRARVLVDTLVDVAQGLRRELALPALPGRPADSVGDDPPAASPASRGRTAGDPALLGQLLEVPNVHLIVDGYNVTKQGYGALPLEEQRVRLVRGLGALAARTRAEITCVFDGSPTGGAAGTGVGPTVPRGVRLRFSASGSSADDLIRLLVAAEPSGRPVVVVTSDRAVIADVLESGAWTTDATALLRLLAAR